MSQFGAKTENHDKKKLHFMSCFHSRQISLSWKTKEASIVMQILFRRNNGRKGKGGKGRRGRKRRKALFVNGSWSGREIGE